MTFIEFFKDIVKEDTVAGDIAPVQVRLGDKIQRRNPKEDSFEDTKDTEGTEEEV